MINECPICGEKIEMFNRGNCPSCGYRSIDDFTAFRTISNATRIDLYARMACSDIAHKIETGADSQMNADNDGTQGYPHRKANKTDKQAPENKTENPEEDTIHDFIMLCESGL